MAFSRNYNPNSIGRGAPNLIFPIVCLWGLIAAILLTIFFSEYGFGDTLSKYYLLPWCLATGAVISAPAIFLIYKGKFDLFHPLVFPAWSYFLPGFFVGGLVLASGLSQPYFLTFIQDERYNLPLTFVYVMLGYGGLVAGFVLPYGRRIGQKIAGWLPGWNWSGREIVKPGLILLALGLANTMIAFVLGIIGFQKLDEIGAFDGTIFLLSLFWLEASFILWLYIFRSKKLGAGEYLIIALLLISSLTKSAFQGNRSSLLQILILVGFAFVLSGRKITFKYNVIGGILVAAALLVGMIYGTAFRSVKQTQEQASLGEMANVIATTADRVSAQDLSTNIGNGFAALAERIESVSSLAVIVSNYEALAPFEESYGINNNIQVELTTFFVPRIIWPDKPVSIPPKQYADLYFNYTENSFTMTPMGDLLRNFGPIGVPIGMLVLGFIIRVMYASLIEGQQFAFWRSAMFYMSFTAIYYEGTYGLIIPYIAKVLFISLLGILIIRFFTGRPSADSLSKTIR